jgi:hypothetical protein
MSSLVFELVSAVVGIGFLAVLAFIVRELRRKRPTEAQEPSTRPETEPALKGAMGPRLAWKKKASEAEPEPFEPPAPRRRQLASFAEAAAAEAEQAERETLVVLPEVPLAQARPCETAPADLSRAETGLLEVADVPAPEGCANQGSDFEETVLARLEDAFDALQSGALTLEAYEACVRAAQAEVEQRIAELSDDTDPTALDAALAARESVRWCLDWAKEHSQQQRGERQ